MGAEPRRDGPHLRARRSLSGRAVAWGRAASRLAAADLHAGLSTAWYPIFLALLLGFPWLAYALHPAEGRAEVVAVGTGRDAAARVAAREAARAGWPVRLGSVEDAEQALRTDRALGVLSASARGAVLRTRTVSQEAMADRALETSAREVERAALEEVRRRRGDPVWPVTVPSTRPDAAPHPMDADVATATARLVWVVCALWVYALAILDRGLLGRARRRVSASALVTGRLAGGVVLTAPGVLLALAAPILRGAPLSSGALIVLAIAAAVLGSLLGIIASAVALLGPAGRTTSRMVIGAAMLVVAYTACDAAGAGFVHGTALDALPSPAARLAAWNPSLHLHALAGLGLVGPEAFGAGWAKPMGALGALSLAGWLSAVIVVRVR